VAAAAHMDDEEEEEEEDLGLLINLNVYTIIHLYRMLLDWFINQNILLCIYMGGAG
jgi:hypothetical protein